MTVVALLLFLFTIPMARPQNQISQPAKPADMSGPQVLDENEFFRAMGVDLSPGSKIDKVNNNLDQVIVVLSGSGLTISAQQKSDTTILSQSDAHFLKARSRLTIANSGENSARVVSIGRKQHWDADVRICGEPMKCTRPIQLGSAEIGHSTLLFTNGFLTAYRHDLIVGGTLSSSYFSSRGKDHLLLIPLTDLHANFDGIDEELKAGKPYASDAGQVEITAGKTAATWIMLRVETPRKPD